MYSRLFSLSGWLRGLTIKGNCPGTSNEEKSEVRFFEKLLAAASELKIVLGSPSALSPCSATCLSMLSFSSLPSCIIESETIRGEFTANSLFRDVIEW